MLLVRILLLVGFGVPVLGVGAFAYRWTVARRRSALYERLRREFHQRREWLEAEFFKRAAASGRPRGLSWVECDFDDAVTFACDRNTGSLRALVAVTIRFEATPGGGMEGVEAVGNLRAATAVFYFDGRRWTTDGRTVFNLNPAETIRHFEHELKSVEE